MASRRGPFKRFYSGQEALKPRWDGNSYECGIISGYAAVASIIRCHMKGFFNILKWVTILIILFFVLFQLLFDKTPEEARGELAKLNIKFNEASFLDRIKDGDAHAVHLFLQAGMDPNVADEKGKTALIHAAEKGRTDIAKLLLDRGAIINAQDKIFGGTPLHWGAFNGHADTIKLLLNAGADPKAVNFKGQTSLYKAAEGGTAAVVRQILDQGGNPNAKSKDGLTPLHAAALTGNGEAAKLLIDKGANVSGQGANGVTPLHLASLSGHAEMTGLLIANGADPNKKDNAGNTPLIDATGGGHGQTVVTLLDKGADPTIKNNKGSRAIDIAQARGQTDIGLILAKPERNMFGPSGLSDTDFHLLGRWVNYNNPHDVVEFRSDKSFIYEMDGGKTINSGKGQIKLKTITWATGNNVDLVGTLKNDTLILEINGQKNTYRRKK
jgi:ankyrin repeat protein